MPGNCRTTVYRANGHGAQKQLHLSEGCMDSWNNGQTYSEAPLRTYPPAWREWCSQCSHRR